MKITKRGETMLKREEYIKEIQIRLSWIATYVSYRNSLNLQDVNVLAEDFICGLLNLVYGYELENLNSVHTNYTAIDLGDKKRRVAIQVTSNNSSSKITTTLNKFVDNGYCSDFDRVIVFIIGQKKNYRNDFEASNGLKINKESDVLDMSNLVKYISTKSTDEIQEVVNYLSKELVYANGFVGSGVYNSANTMFKKVQALCVSRMLLPNVSQEVAEEIVLNDQNSEKYKYIMDRLQEGKRYLVGGFGSGKTHALLILCSKILFDYMNGLSDNMAIYLHARDVVKAGSIEEAIKPYFTEKGNNLLVIDGLDEINYEYAKQIIQEERFLSITDPEFKILIGTRPMTYLPDESKLIKIRDLTFEEQKQLVETICTNGILNFTQYTVPDRLQEAITKPLFCIIYAVMQNGGITNIKSEIDLLTAFIENATKDVSEGSKEIRQDLISLAVAIVNNDFNEIHISNIHLSHSLDSLLKTGLISKQGEFLNFTLAIVAQYFAACSLQEGSIKIESILSGIDILERWKTSLAILFSKMTFTESKDIFAKVIKTAPGIAAQIIRYGTTAEKIMSLPSSRECGNMLLDCMAVWRESLTELMDLTVGKETLKLALFADQNNIVYSWHNVIDLPDLEILPRKKVFFGFSEAFSEVPAAQATWPWIITFEYISRKLGKLLKERRVSHLCTQLYEEELWDDIRFLCDKGSLYHEEIQLQELEKFRPYNDGYLSYKGRSVDIKQLFNHIDSLTQNGTNVIRPPFPVADQEYTYNIWSCYSKERLLELTRHVYSNAMECYLILSEMVFAPFKDWMHIATTFPNKCIGNINWVESGISGMQPIMQWYLEVLPLGSTSQIDIEYREDRTDSEDVFRKIKDSYIQNRADLTFRHAFIDSSVLRLNESTPVTTVVYKWLENDLKKIGWLSR